MISFFKRLLHCWKRVNKDKPKTGSWLAYYQEALIEGAYLSNHNPNSNNVTNYNDVKELYDINKLLTDNMKDFIKKTISSKDADRKFVLLPLQYTTSPSKVLYPFSIPFTVEIDNDGVIHINPPEKGSFPVISREFLSPNNDNYPPIADLDNLWNKSKDIRDKEYKNWNDYIKDVFDFFEQVTETEIGKEIGEGFNWNNLGIDKGDVFTIQHLQKLYNKITSDSKYSKYYDKLFTGADCDKEIIKENNLYASRHHFGHMDNKFSLSKTQREAIHSWLVYDNLQNSKGHMRVMAVNGPPGTGKTTVLSGLIASHIVRCVYHKEYPRFILTSFTNNAVTNIINSLSLLSNKSCLIVL